MVPPALVAHRGYPARYPENSLPGIAAALAAGARRVEIDVQLAADGVPAVYHDRTLDRVSGVAGELADRPFSDLARLPAGEPGRFGDRFSAVRIAALAEAVELVAGHPGVTLFVEVKHAAVERFGVAAVLDRVAPELDRLTAAGVDGVLISRRPDLLAAAGGRRRGLILASWRQLGRPETADLAPDFLFADRRRLPRRGDLSDPLGSGAPLAVYEVAEPAAALALGRRGVALVETFAIAEMLAALGPPPGEEAEGGAAAPP